MRLAYSTNAYTRHALPDALRSIASLGYAGAEILCDAPHWRPTGIDDAGVDEVAALLAELGLSVSNLNANTANHFFDPSPAENGFEPSLSSANDAYRRWRIDSTLRTIDIAARLGAGCVSVTSGRPTPGSAPDKSLALFVDSLKEICLAAERRGVRVGVEYEPGLLVERATELAVVIDRVGSAALGANWDIGHSFLDGESPEDAVRLIGGRIWNVHVEDIAARKHFHLVPGDGDLPFRRYIEALRSVDYDGFLTVELYTYPERPDDVGRRALEFLAALL
jgi:sugar phosphate isomerase/epimerase